MYAPEVTVLLPTYNASRFLRVAVESVLAQTLGELELLAVDDGSTDDTVAILTEYSRSDSRVRLVTGVHRGLPAVLNDGLGRARGRYVARMDADDVCHPRRLERQLSLIERRGADICGCRHMVIDEEGRHLGDGWVPVDENLIHVKLLFSVPFVHSAVVMRRAFLTDHRLSYGSDPATAAVEDYRLWVGFYEHGARFANLDECLLQLRTHQGSFMGRKRTRMKLQQRRVSRRMIERHGTALARVILSLSRRAPTWRPAEKLLLSRGALRLLRCDGPTAAAALAYLGGRSFVRAVAGALREAAPWMLPAIHMPRLPSHPGRGTPGV